jgi:hypothetical protein
MQRYNDAKKRKTLMCGKKVKKRKTLIPRSLHPSDSLLGLGPYVEENEQKRKRKRKKEKEEMK